MAKATTVRFTDEVYARLDQASSWTGMPVNSIVVAAVLEWMQRHSPDTRLTPDAFVAPAGFAAPATRPRWATLRRAVRTAVAERTASPMYPFERFTKTAQKMLTAAQVEAQKGSFSYIGTEHLLLAAYAEPSSEAARVLADLGIREDTIRFLIKEALQGKVAKGVHRIVPTSRVKRVIEIAFQLCGAKADPNVSTGHILLALATEGQGIAAHVLKDTGATPDHIEKALEGVVDREA